MGPIEGEANVAHSKRKFQKGSSFGTKFIPQSSTSRKIQKKKGDKEKVPTIADKGKGKTKVVDKRKCFHCGWSLEEELP